MIFSNPIESADSFTVSKLGSADKTCTIAGEHWPMMMLYAPVADHLLVSQAYQCIASVSLSIQPIPLHLCQGFFLYCLLGLVLLVQQVWTIGSSQHLFFCAVDWYVLCCQIYLQHIPILPSMFHRIAMPALGQWWRPFLSMMDLSPWRSLGLLHSC